MVKVKNFFMRNSEGTLAGASFYRTRGMSVMREIVAGTNPKTEAQMLHRIPFAAMVKFYTNATKSFFKFAFERKGRFESDYNAFMRENFRLGINIYPTREEYLDSRYPMIAPYLMSQGSLRPMNIIWDSSEFYTTSVRLSNNSSIEGKTWKDVLALNPYLQMGDIITCVYAGSTCEFNGENIDPGDAMPEWSVSQIVIGDSLEDGSLKQYIEKNNLSLFPDENNKLCLGYVPVSHGFANHKSRGAAFILTRKTRRGLLVSTQQMSLNSKAQEVFEFLSDDGYRALPSWKTSDEAILEGGATVPMIEYDYSAKVKKMASQPMSTTPVVIASEITPEIPNFYVILVTFIGGPLSKRNLSFTKDTLKSGQIEGYGSFKIQYDETLGQIIFTPDFAESKTFSWTDIIIKVNGKDIGVVGSL